MREAGFTMSGSGWVKREGGRTYRVGLWSSPGSSAVGAQVHFEPDHPVHGRSTVIGRSFGSRDEALGAVLDWLRHGAEGHFPDSRIESDFDFSR